MKNISTVPWFPRHISDLYRYPNQIISNDDELDIQSPGFTDIEYKKRR